MPSPAATLTRTRRFRRGQVGSVTLELTVLFPAVLLLIFGIVQAAVWYHGRTLAMLAAQDGLRVTQALEGTAAAGRAETTAALADNGGRGFLVDPQVTASRTPTSATVTVTARSVALLPGFSLPVRQRAAGPIERVP